MRLNGLFVVCEKAVRALGDPRATEYRVPFLLGALREDVWFMQSPKPLVVEHFSISHFYSPRAPGGLIPYLSVGPRRRANAYFSRAIRAYQKGEHARAFVYLGRIAHLVADMSCPVHAQRVVHETDPYEWWVDAHKEELLALPLPVLEEDAECTRASDAIERMSRFAQSHRADRTNHFFGRILKELGTRTGVTREEAATQARVLVPMAAFYTRSVLRLFLRQIDACSRERIAS